MWSWPVVRKQLSNFIDGKITRQEADIPVQDVAKNLYVFNHKQHMTHTWTVETTII